MNDFGDAPAATNLNFLLYSTTRPAT